MRITVPVRCACPTRNQTDVGINYLLSYPVAEGETVSSISALFGEDPERTLEANQLPDPSSTIFFETSLLVPLRNPPSRITVPSPPPPPPPSPSPPNSTPSGSSDRTWIYILAGVLGGVGLILVVCKVIFCMFFSKTKKKTDPIISLESFEAWKASVWYFSKLSHLYSANGVSLWGCCLCWSIMLTRMMLVVDPGKYEEALEIFSKMQEARVKPDKAACNILVEKCCKAGETWPIIQILQYMKENHLVLRYPIFLLALETLKAAGERDALLRQVHPHISVECIDNERVVEYKRNDFEDPSSLDRGLVWVLLKKQNLQAVDSLLTELMDKTIKLDSELMSAIVHVNCGHCRVDGALLTFKYSVKTGIKLERTAYLALIGCLIRSNTFTDIVEIVVEMTSTGHSLGVYLASLLIYRLGCARRPTCAAKIFDSLPDDQKCVATYTALVGVYFAAGTADKGLKIYKAMRKKGIYPSLGTYCVLVAGLEKLGRVSNAETYWKEKKSLQKDAYFRESIPMEEKICDLLFARDVVS